MGDDPTGGAQTVQERLDQHHGKFDFWDWAVIFVAKDDSLNKAHVQHLEASLLALAKSENKQQPTPPTLSEAEKALGDSFLQDVLSIFPLLGLGVFEKPETIKQPAELLMIESKEKGITGSGYEAAKGFVVVKGSQLVKDEVSSIHQFLSTLRKDLLAQGVIAAEGPHYVFTQDHVFNSPSTAAGVILGRSANGRIEWKNRDGKTLKQLQAAATGVDGDKSS